VFIYAKDLLIAATVDGSALSADGLIADEEEQRPSDVPAWARWWSNTNHIQISSNFNHTASRVCGRMEAVLDWARVRGYRTGENPARWRGHLNHLLPAEAKVRKVEHHAALSYARIGAFLAALRKQNGIAARALEFLVLTATRTGETLGARSKTSSARSPRAASRW
jgi:integrase